MAIEKKERIKDRMQKTAARLWGIPDNEIETNFDPLVLLLIEACASEMEKIGHAINTSHDRLLEKLADLIVPEAVVGAKPSSAIAVAIPAEATATFTNLTAFAATQSILNQNTNSRFNQQVCFTPIGNFKLLKTRLAYTVIGQKLYKVNDGSSRELLHNAAAGAPQNKINELWLGITLDKDVHDLNNLSMYFDLRSHSLAATFYGSLGQASAFVGNAELALGSGYQNQEQFELNPEDMLLLGHDYMSKINRQLSNIYEQQFLYVSDNTKLVRGGIPEELEAMLPKALATKIAGEPMVYIKIKLSRYFAQEDMDGLSIHINAFPVVNRKLHTQHYRTDPWINIIPIQVDGHFLDIHSIQSTGGSKFKFKVSADNQNLNDGEALIRSSGVGKTNSKEVRDIIANLMDAIRDESAYFSELNNDFISSRLKEISQILSRLDDQMQKSKDSKAAKHYVLLKPKTAGETVAISYWTTDGAIANQVNAGAALSPYNHSMVSNKDAYLVSSAQGGRDRTLDNEKKALLKQQIISKGKIISAVDIKMLCSQLFGKNLNKVLVEKSTIVGNNSNDGFSRVIQIQLDLVDKNASDVTYLCRQLETILKNEGSPVYPFVVYLK